MRMKDSTDALVEKLQEVYPDAIITVRKPQPEEIEEED